MLLIVIWKHDFIASRVSFGVFRTEFQIPLFFIASHPRIIAKIMSVETFTTPDTLPSIQTSDPHAHHASDTDNLNDFWIFKPRALANVRVYTCICVVHRCRTLCRKNKRSIRHARATHIQQEIGTLHKTHYNLTVVSGMRRRHSPSQAERQQQQPSSSAALQQNAYRNGRRIASWMVSCESDVHAEWCLVYVRPCSVENKNRVCVWYEVAERARQFPYNSRSTVCILVLLFIFFVFLFWWTHTTYTRWCARRRRSYRQCRNNGFFCCFVSYLLLHPIKSTPCEQNYEVSVLFRIVTFRFVWTLI